MDTARLFTCENAHLWNKEEEEEEEENYIAFLPVRLERKIPIAYYELRAIVRLSFITCFFQKKVKGADRLYASSFHCDGD